MRCGPVCQCCGCSIYCKSPSKYLIHLSLLIRSEVLLWTLEERRARADLIEVYKIIQGISSVSFDTFFEFNSYGTTRGHSDTHWSLWKREHRLIWDTTFSQSELSIIGKILIIKQWRLDQSTSSKGIWKDLEEIDLFVGNWCYLIFWGWAVPSVRPRPLSFLVSYVGVGVCTLQRANTRKLTVKLFSNNSNLCDQ